MFVNFNKGSSNVLLYKDLLFLKHTGISTILEAKKDVMVDRRKKLNALLISSVWISSSVKSFRELLFNKD